MRSPSVSFAVAAALAAGLCLGCEKQHAAPVDPTPTAAPHAPTVASTQAATPPTKQAPPAEASKPAKPKPMNVILLVVDAMRDDMPWNGYKRDIAPNLTRLHAKSISYERGYSISSFTSKSVAGLISGQYPSSLSRTTPFFTKYRDKNTFLAEVLQERGIRTLGAHAHMYLKEAAGFHQGFEVWEMVPKIEWDYNKDPFITSPDHTKLVINQLSRPENVSGKFFAYYHYMDPHDTYNSHEVAPKWGKRARDRYDEEIWFTDLHIEKMLNFVWSQPWGKQTAIVVTGDHGEAFGEHKFYKHAFEVYEVLVRVPLFVHIPGVEPRTIARWRGHIDLAPTICELMGVPVPDWMAGTSLVPELLGEQVPPRAIVADLPADSFNVRHRALIEEQSGYKLVAMGRDMRFELYNVRKDPGETLDLIKSEPERAEQMIARYKELSKAIPEVKAEGGKPVKPE
ncbi:MAG: sulfatase-like hydrolase/transferase [Polyangiaceae bacterium]|jgi:arylsulfatase A-like enzyme|nr:sulfatase-like hydrolase/transferase [Polyangiaceae bacterium]